jgi:hypothetical protein
MDDRMLIDRPPSMFSQYEGCFSVKTGVHIVETADSRFRGNDGECYTWGQSRECYTGDPHFVTVRDDGEAPTTSMTEERRVTPQILTYCEGQLRKYQVGAQAPLAFN